MSDDASEHAVEIAGLIRARVRAAVDDAPAIVAAVRDRFGPDQIPDASLAAWVSDALDQQAADETSWPDETDCDRLDVALESLLREGILACQNAGPDPAAAMATVADAFVAAGGEAAGVIGFCCYDYPDLLRAADGDDLLLSFGEASGDPDGGAHIGRRIRAALEAGGLAVRWDGTVGERIAVVDLVWRRRRP